MQITTGCDTVSAFAGNWKVAGNRLRKKMSSFKKYFSNWERNGNCQITYIIIFKSLLARCIAEILGQARSKNCDTGCFV